MRFRQSCALIHYRRPSRPALHRRLGLGVGRAPVPRTSEPEVVGLNAKDALGKHGEQLAAEYLQQAGFRIVDRNWRCAKGEIDIVMVDRRALVACQVKTRSSTEYGTPLEAITRQKIRRLRHLAVSWVLAHGVLFAEIAAL